MSDTTSVPSSVPPQLPLKARSWRRPPITVEQAHIDGLVGAVESILREPRASCFT